MSWLFTLSDVMSLLLIVFLVWTTVQIVEKEGRTPKKGPEPIEELHSTLLEFTPAEVKDGKLVIVLQEDVSFELGKAHLTRQGKRMLERLAPILRRETGYEIEILGHTDDLPVRATGQWKSNFQLSLARAASVCNYLADLRISPLRLKVQGLGPLYPVIPNDTDVHRAVNRRVELVLKPLRKRPTSYSSLEASARSSRSL